MAETLKVSDVLKKKVSGYKAVMNCDLPDLKLICEIKHETMNSKDIKEQHKVIFRDTAGNEISRKYVGIGSRKLKWVTADGKETEDGLVRAYQLQDGKEVVVAPFEKTEAIKITKTAPREIIDDFLCERTIELWGEDQETLYKLADYLCQNGKVALASFNTSKGYDTQHLLLIEARIIENNKFGLIGHLARKHLIFNHLMDLNAPRTEKAKAKGLDLVAGIL